MESASSVNSMQCTLIDIGGFTPFRYVVPVHKININK
jgi:hypothetical protein